MPLRPGPCATLTAAALIAVSAGNAPAATISFDADDGVVFVRAYDQFGSAVVEFIGEAGAIYQCVVMDAAGDPIATAAAMADVGQMILQGIEAARIDSIACRKVM